VVVVVVVGDSGGKRRGWSGGVVAIGESLKSGVTYSRDNG